MSLNNYYFNAIEGLGWWIREYDDYFEIGKESPAGEDFSFTIGKNNIVQAVTDYAWGFDPDEHAEMWIQCMHTVSGVPKSIIALIDDANEIQRMLNELADALIEIENGGKAR